MSQNQGLNQLFTFWAFTGVHKVLTFSVAATLYVVRSFPLRLHYATEGSSGLKPPVGGSFGLKWPDSGGRERREYE